MIKCFGASAVRAHALGLAARKDKGTTEEKERRNKERAHIIQPQLLLERHRTGVGVVEEGRLGGWV